MRNMHLKDNLRNIFYLVLGDSRKKKISIRALKVHYVLFILTGFVMDARVHFYNDKLVIVEKERRRFLRF